MAQSGPCDPFLSVTTELTDRMTGTITSINFYASACIRQRTSFSVTLSREKTCPVGPSLCTTAPSLKKKNLSIPDVLGEGRL